MCHFLGKSSINGPFSMAMLNNQRVMEISSSGDAAETALGWISSGDIFMAATMAEAFPAWDDALIGTQALESLIQPRIFTQYIENNLPTGYLFSLFKSIKQINPQYSIASLPSRKFDPDLFFRIWLTPQKQDPTKTCPPGTT